MDFRSVLGAFLLLAVATVRSQSDGGNITLNATAKISVVCHTDFIEVSLKREDYPGLIMDNVSFPHLEDKRCKPGYDDNETVRFTFGLEHCGTEQEDDGDSIIYKNTVYLDLNFESENADITREHQQQIPFQCSFKKTTTISKVSYSPRITLVITDAENIGNFTYFMDMYEDQNNTKKVESFPKEVGLGQPMYFGFRVTSGDSKLVVFPDVCKATLSSDYDGKPDHLIIENACSRDNTLKYKYEESAEHFFSLAAFRFKSGYDDTYIHCKLTVCREDDSDSRCVRGCEGGSRRKRRSLEDEMSASLYIGPVKFSNSQGKQRGQLESDPRQVAEDSNSMIVIVAVLVGVLGAVAIGLIVALVVVTRRRRYQAATNLVVAEGM